MRILPRRLLLIGGALAVASAGFAYMANNLVNASSLGDGQGNVTGYTVSNISYPGVIQYKDYFNCQTGGSQTGDTATGGSSACDYYNGITTSFVTNVTFTLTSAATTAPANGKPSQVQLVADWTNPTNASNSGTTLLTGGPSPAFDGVCTVNGWTTNANSANSGTVTCTLYIDTSNEPPVQWITGLDVEANQ